MRDPIDQIIGENIRRHRLRKEIALSAFAEKLGVSCRDMEHYEAGTNRIGSARLWRAAEILDLAVSELFRSPA
jgi:transcriptional regulator with XRE-family HTH domain